MATNDGAAGPPGAPPSPAKLWHEAKGDHARYIQLMIEHGHIIPVSEPQMPQTIDTAANDPWEQVALAASKNAPVDVAKVVAEANAPICATCRRVVSLTDKGIVKVHFATNAETRPCAGSWKAWNG